MKVLSLHRSFRSYGESFNCALGLRAPVVRSPARTADNAVYSVGMDLHKVTFPTFVLEPRSMLERITDFMSHPDLLFGRVPSLISARSLAHVLPSLWDTASASTPTHSRSHSDSAENCDDPEERFIRVLQYYLAGWHIKPKGVKKPYVRPFGTCRCPASPPARARPCVRSYNPVLGEFFRCRYDYPDGSRGYYIAEQGTSITVITTRNPPCRRDWTLWVQVIFDVLRIHIRGHSFSRYRKYRRRLLRHTSATLCNALHHRAEVANEPWLEPQSIRQHVSEKSRCLC